MFLELQNVSIPTKDEEALIVRDVSFEVKEGSIHAIIGPNGSGKSTLAYAIMGLENYNLSQGRILLMARILPICPLPSEPSWALH